MAHKAHRRLVEDEAQGLTRRRSASASSAAGRRRSSPRSGSRAQAGNTYTASLYLCLAWLLEREGATLEDRELALFSYGSGCCAEFFTARRVPGSAARAARIGAQALLQARRELTVAEYEEFARAARRRGAARGGRRRLLPPRRHRGAPAALRARGAAA